MPPRVEFINMPTDRVESVSGLLDLKGGAIPRRVEAMAVVQLPNRIRLELSGGGGVEAVVILAAGKAWIARPPDRLVYATTVDDLSQRLLGVHVNAEDLAGFLTGRQEFLQDWTAEGRNFDSAREQSLRIRTKIDPETAFPVAIELLQKGKLQATFRWRQVQFNTDPDPTAFLPPSGYAECDWETITADTGITRTR